MALTPEGGRLTEAHRQVQAHVNAAVLRDLLQLWGVVDPRNLRHTVDPFTRAAAALVIRGRRASSSASSHYYAAFREAEGQGRAPAPAIAADPPAELVTAALRGGALAGIMSAYRRGQSPEAAHQNGFVKLAGSASQLVVGGGRATIMDAIGSDHAAIGWQRVTDGDPCAFCAMIASQGIIAKSADTAGFEAHGHCLCTAEPAFEDSPVNAQNAKFREAWNGATSGLSGGDALNAFRRSMSSPDE